MADIPTSAIPATIEAPMAQAGIDPLLSQPLQPSVADTMANLTSVPAQNGNTDAVPLTAEAMNGSSLAGAAAAAQTDNTQSMSADEISLYDRQIRLWGKKAQEKIRTAHVLLIGMKGLGNEVAKNLVLAGIGSLTIIDDQEVTEEDLGAQFLIREEDVGKNRAQAVLKELQAMNPRVRLVANTSSPLQLALSPVFFQDFSIVIATDLTIDLLQPLNAACRLQPRPFYAASTFGLYGYIFADLGVHTFGIEREKSNIPTKIGAETVTRSIIAAEVENSDNGKVIEKVTKTEQYSPLSQVVTASLPADRVSTRRRKLQISPVLACIRALWAFQVETARPYPNETREDLATYTRLVTAEHKNVLNLPHETLRSELLRHFLQGVSAEINPTCAFLGGQLAQDVINVISQNAQPIQNLLVFDGDEFTGEVYAMHPIPTDLTTITQTIPGATAVMPIQTLSAVTPVTDVNGDIDAIQNINGTV